MIFFRIFNILFLPIALWLLGFCWFLEKINIAEPQINKKYDAIVVLTGAKGRIDTGMQLLWDKHAEHLFVSGVGQYAILKDLSQYLDSFTPKQAESLKSSITLGHLASSTEENALETLHWIRDKHYKNIILVTSNYHIPRSLYLFESLMPEINFTPYPLVKSHISLKLAFIEYNKYLYVIFRGKNSTND
jgi:uncharacterized SAM-binding protein YcdF (DUF218 family)